MGAKDAVRSLFRYAGLDVRRFRPGSSEDAALCAMLRAHNVDVIFDIGANTGQFGRLLRSAGYRGRIVSFEPLSSARNQLLITAGQDRQWNVADQIAVGDEDKEIEIHISGNSVSSSILGMLETHINAAPASSYVGSETVQMRKLDSVATSYLVPDEVLFVKIDTQGYEDRVLRGASAVLQRAVGLQLELSLVPLYEDQRQYEEMIKKLRELGFELWSISPAFIDPRNGRLLQVDATFFRSTSE